MTAPRLAAKARLIWDRKGRRHLLLYPERGLALNGAAAAIVQLLDGRREPAEIAERLASRFDVGGGASPAAIVEQFLGRLSDLGLLDGTVATACADSSRPATTEKNRDAAPRPFTLIAELTYRCPLACPYCSNPVERVASRDELAAPEWRRVFFEARELGVAQVHLTGGEPLLRTELEAIVFAARSAGLYTNLVTSGVPLEERRFRALAEAGVDHVQLSFQAPSARSSDRMAGRRAFSEKLRAVFAVQRAGTPLTLNFVLSRESIHEVERAVRLAETLGVTKIELAHVQYHGFALLNRDALLPSAAAVDAARKSVRLARERTKGKLEIVHVLPDYHSERPRACMDGWGRRYLHVSPDGIAAPCHQARSLPDLRFENVRSRPLSYIWHESPSFNAFRGEAWMREPCRSCSRRAQDFGGCRCQAFALTGDAFATDPACALAPDHAQVLSARRQASERSEGFGSYRYRTPRAESPLVTLRRGRHAP